MIRLGQVSGVVLGLFAMGWTDLAEAESSVAEEGRVILCNSSTCCVSEIGNRKSSLLAVSGDPTSQCDSRMGVAKTPRPRDLVDFWLVIEESRFLD